MRPEQLPVYEVYAIRYATVNKKRATNFMVHDPHDVDMPMDYFVWLVRGNGKTILVDTGFNSAAAAARQRDFLRCPIEALSRFQLSAADVSDVLLTHLHYDHAGNIRLLPHAKFHLQEAELQYATGKYMQYDLMRHPYDVDDVVDVVRGVYDKRVIFYRGDAEFHQGIELLHIGGHTQGLQAVRVHTSRGWIVLASDASHYYENMLSEAPFPIVFHVGDMLEGYEKIRRSVPSAAHIIPGHDPLVMQAYPQAEQFGEGVVALHLDPDPAVIDMSRR